MSPTAIAALFVTGFVVAGFAWLGLVAIPRRVHAVEDLRAFAVARGLRCTGDGAVGPVQVVGEHRGRMFTIAWQPGLMLLVGIDCETAARGPVGDGFEAGDAALVCRWTEPPADLFGRLDALIDAMAALAEELERTRPGEEAE